MSPDKSVLGVQGENKIERLVFKLDNFIEGTPRLETRQNGEAEYLTMQSDIEKEEYSILISNELLMDNKSIDLQLRILGTDKETLFLSELRTFYILEGINANKEILKKQPKWVDEVDKRLDEAEEDIEELKQNIDNKDYEEKDPTVPNHVKAIKQEDINKWDNKAEKTDIPDTSEFITKAVNDLINYFTKNEILTMLGNISSINIEIVDTLPTTGESSTIYFVAIEGKENNIYNEYMYINNKWELIGSTQVDLTGYAKEDWVNTQIKDFLTATQINDLINNSLKNYYTTTQTDAKLYEKVDKETGKSLVEDIEIARLKTVKNYDDTELRNELANKVNKSTIITEVSNDTLLLDNNQDARLGELATLILNMPSEIDERYESCFSFRSGETPTTLTYSATPIKWQGDDCNASGEFIPEANTNYEISIRKVNAEDIVARVGGY